MHKFIGLTRRNLLVYFKDRTSVFFSMLTPLIIFVLYLLFLRQTYVNSIENAAEALMDFIQSDDIAALSNGLLLTGIMGAALINIPYNCLFTMIRDREAKVDYDICATPVSRVQIILSYFTASAISAFLMTSVIFGAGIAILCASCKMYLTFQTLLALFGVILIGSVSSTAIFMTILMFFKNSSSGAAFLGILSAGSGFVIGAYIPLSEFSEGISTICHLFPATCISVLIRRFLLTGVLDHIDEGIGGIDNGLFTASVRNSFSFQSVLSGKAFGWNQTMIYVMIVTGFFLLATALIYPRIYKRK